MIVDADRIRRRAGLIDRDGVENGRTTLHDGRRVRGYVRKLERFTHD